MQSNSEFGQMDHSIDAEMLPSQHAGTETTIAEVGEARQKLFHMQMNKAAQG